MKERHFRTSCWLMLAITGLLTSICAQPAYQFTTFAGQNTPPGSTDGPGSSARFDAPTGIVVDAAGNVFIADNGNRTIRKISPSGIVSTFAGQAGVYGTNDGTGPGARFHGPAQITLDRDGNLLVVESSSFGSVRKITPDGVVTTIAGGPLPSNWQDGPLSWAGFDRPRGLAVDSEGTIFVIDTSENTVRKVSTAGFVATIAGSSVGAGQVDITDGPGERARFNGPTGATMDAAGNLFIADTGNHTIRRITPDNIVSTFAGIPRAPGSVDGTTTTARFNGPKALVFDAAGNLYVADTNNHTIRKISSDGIVTTIAGLALTYGGDDGTGNLARFSSPAGLAVDAGGVLYVADTFNNTVRRVTPSGVVTTIAGRATMASSDGSAEVARFVRPQRVVADATGTLYVTDGSHTVRKVSPAGVVTTLAGKSGFIGSVDATGADARFNEPQGLAVDTAGNVYVADRENHTIRKISPSGLVTTLAGQPGSPGNADGIGSAARFRSPNAVAADGLGNVFVADLGNSRIRQISPGGMVTTLAGGAHGRTDGVGAAAGFTMLLDLVVDRNGVLFVLDYSAIRKITPSGEVSTYAGHSYSRGFDDGPVGTARFAGISGIALDATGNLFLTDSNAIRKITSDGHVVTLGGSLDASGLVDGVGGLARFNGLSGIAVDTAGNLYVADSGNSVLRKGMVSLTAVAPPIITNPYGGSMKLVAGDTMTLQVMATGSEPLLYQWYRNNEPLAGATSATLTLSGVSAASEGSYVATVRNSAALATLPPTTIAVYTPALTSFAIRRSVNGGAFLWSIAAGNGRLVTVGSNGTILTSTDGRTWARQISGTTDWLVGVTYGQNQFVAVGDQGRILTSPDGQTWTHATNSGTTQRLNNVVYGGGTFVAVGEGGAVVTSTDTMTWVPRSSGVTTWLRGLAYNAKENSFALSGQNGVFRTSVDAITWKTEPQVTIDGDLEATVAMNSHSTFMNVGQDGRVMSAHRYYFARWTQPSMGYFTWTWSQARAATNVRLRGVAEGANAIFVTGENGVILTAPEIGGPWARLSSGTTANLVSGVFAGNTLYIVGENETIVQSDALYSSRLVNISTRGQVAAGNPMISGFVVTGSVPKKVLLRAAGPALAAFAVPGALTAPTLTLFDGAQRPIATNSGWGTQVDVPAIVDASTRVGAFPFVSNSGDSAMLVTLSPGAYTAQVTTHAADGVSLIEAYDADVLSDEGSRAVNISTRGFAGTGSDKLIAGFVLNGTAARRVLIRAVGPSLAPFGVPNTLARPQLQLFNSRGVLQQTAGAWSSQMSAGEMRSAAVISGAFPLLEGSTDAVWLTTLSPGAWTVQVSGENNTTGNVLLEVYDLP